MPIPSLYIAGEGARTWSITRAAAYGAVIGALAAVLKMFSPLHLAVSGMPGESYFANIPEIIGAALGFALLCAGACALRNFIARRLIWPELR